MNDLEKLTQAVLSVSINRNQDADAEFPQFNWSVVCLADTDRSYQERVEVGTGYVSVAHYDQGTRRRIHVHCYGATLDAALAGALGLVERVDELLAPADFTPSDPELAAEGMSTAEVDAETGEIALTPDDVRLSWQPMTEDQARKVTTDIKTYATRLCHLVRDAKTGQAWTPLGYDTWAEYVETEFGMSRQRAQQLIDHANKLDLLSEVVELAAPPVDQVPERATRGLKADDLRSALVAAMEESPAELSEAERLVVANKAIDTLRKAKATASTAVDAVTSKNSVPVDPTPTVTEGSQQAPAPAATHPPHGENAQHGDAPAAGTTADTPATGAAGDGTGTPQTGPVASPSLPANWRDYVANAAYLLRLPVNLVADAATPDDIADLSDLTNWCFQFVQAIPDQEQNT